MPRAAHIVLAAAMLVAVACGGAPRPVVTATPEAAPSTVTERILAMLPEGAQVVVEIDLARLRANPVVGEVVTRGLAERTADLPAGVPASPLAASEQVVLAAYGVGTAQAATLTVLAADHDLAGTTKIAEGFYAIGPPDWVDQAQQRVAFATTGEAKFAIHAAPELLELRRRAMPAHAPGASLRITARLPFDARIALARQTGLDAAPAQLSAWGDVADDLALVVDCDAADPGNRPEGRSGGRSGGQSGSARGADAPRRLEASLRGALAAVSETPAARLLGLPSSLTGAKFVAHGSWVRTIIAIGPAHLRRIVERATALLGAPAPASSPATAPASPPAAPPSSSPTTAPASPPATAPASPPPAAPPSSLPAPAPRGDHAS
jgi:hypothetical protein